MAGHCERVIDGYGHGLDSTAFAPGLQFLQPFLLEGAQRMGNLVFFHNRDASFDRQLLGLAEMLLPVARGQSVRCILPDGGPDGLRPSKWRSA